MGRGIRPALLPAAGCPLPLPARSREGGTLIFEGFRTGGASLAAHELAARATDAYEGAKKKVQEFLNAGSPN